MRSFLNAILSFIGAESLTDVEFDSVTITTMEYSQASYGQLSIILEARENVSTAQERLIAYFTAKGVEVSPIDTGHSNILIGDLIED